MDIITVSNIRNVRECGGPSEEEPGFILNSFVIEEAHSWSLFTDTPDTMVRLRSVLVDHDLKTFTGQGYCRINILFRHSQCQPPLKPIPHPPHVLDSAHFLRSSLVSESLPDPQ